MPRESATDAVTFVGPAHSKAGLGLGSWTGCGPRRPFWSPSSVTTAPDPRDQPVAPQALYKQGSFGRGRTDLRSRGCKSSPSAYLREHTSKVDRQGKAGLRAPVRGRLRSMQMQVDKHAAAWAPGPADSPTPARRSTTASGACRGWGGRAQLPTRCTAQGGRQAGGRRAGGTRSKQEDRRFHTPDSRQWTESGDADKGPTVQRAGVGADFPPSRVQSTLNQACGGKGEPRVSGSVACRGARHSRDGAASRRWGGRFGEAVLGCQISGPQGRGSPESDEGPRGHGRPIWASEPPAGPPPARSRASFGSGREVCSCGRHRRREAVWNHGGGGGGLALRGGQGRGGRAANQNQNRGRGAGGGGGAGGAGLALAHLEPLVSRVSGAGGGWGAVQQAVSARGSPRGT